MLHAKFQGFPVMEREIIKGHLDHLYKLSFPLPKEAPYVI